MSKPVLPALIWSQANHTYDLLANGVFQQPFAGEDERAWQGWLETQTGFSFQGQGGHLSVLKEAHSHETGDWYAYASHGQRQIKRSLGKTETITLARLEEIAATLTQMRESTLSAHPTTSQTAAVFSPPSTPFPLVGLSEPGSFSGSLLLPKLLPPRLPGTLVTRERLIAQLDQTLTHGLTLLSASAGFGKTTLLSTWAAHCLCPVAWLSLDEQDNHPMRFWSYVIAALRTTEPTLGEIALSMLYSPRPPALPAILTTLINDFVAGQEERVLVLDDYHVIDDPDIASSFLFLLKHLPSRLHLILAGRTDPPLALPRLRACGQVIEIRDRDLRFTSAEAARFLLQAMQLPLVEAEVNILEQRTEGWIAGLQLAALAMRAHADSSAFVQQLSGSQRFILDYMQTEVLECQPQEIQDFLLRTAILTRLHASLCQAVTLGTNTQESQQMLLALETANLFLVPLDEERHWYRLHGLFRDVLQARLRTLFPECIPILHQRAAHWYAQQGDARMAIIHALTGADYDFAATLMEQSAEQMCFNGEGTQLDTWIKRLPDALLLTHGRLALTTVLQLLFSTFNAPNEQWEQTVNRTEQTIARLDPLLESPHAVALSESEARLLHNRLALLRNWIAARAARMQGDEEQRRRLGSQMQELARDDDVVWKMLPTFNRFDTDKNQVAMLPLLSALKQQAEREQHHYEAAWLMVMLALAYQQAGQLHQTYQNYREALQRLQQMGKARAQFGYSHLYLAQIHWVWNQLEEAQAHIATAQQFAQTWHHINMQIQVYCQSILVLLALGKQAEAEQALAEAEQLFQQHQWQHLRTRVMTARAQIWLAQGNLVALANWAAQKEIDPHLLNHINELEYAEYLALVRAYLALQKTIEALSLLTLLLALAEQHQNIWHIVQVLVLQVVALYASGEAIQAQQVAAHLLQLAEPADYLRLYLDAGDPMRQVLQSILNAAHTLSERDASPALLDSVRTLLAAFGQQTSQAAHIEQPSSLPLQAIHYPPLSPLTAREQEVLHLLAQGTTNQEIADRLVISFATAKKHVANILSKLGAENRVQAIARAREYALL
ncbi:LuxR family transcriptional regulator [Ktedonobacter sp. SOSP1-85]|uniref:LuxR C-terminal-related transcriptional regulator n=1 Tax=Ktedonobacter sp. SOSP1-85 TaxID=2778367 RepID=UPI001914E17A|nr:LuxR C-terminal-related transcriptional regulator [Ktedonobacter sp. SOSP1-85]GHO72333.1 LuxR family transcriptional regulator [Ktedonobacter sp. SOSP1-85]